MTHPPPVYLPLKCTIKINKKLNLKNYVSKYSGAQLLTRGPMRYQVKSLIIP